MYSPPPATLAAKYVIKTHYIMKVLEFHPEDQTVDLIQDVFEFTNAPQGPMTINNEFGNTVTVTLNNLDVIPHVPVKLLRWGQFEIQACPAPGDTGYIEVFTNDIRDWVENGGPSIPWSDAHFVKTNCVFVPFVPNAKNASPAYPSKEDGSADNTKMIIKSANASIVFEDVPAATEGGEAMVTLTTTAQTINVNAEKGINITGNINATGDITVTGAISASGDIIAGKGGAKEISLLKHIHPATTTATVGTGPAGTVEVGAPE